MDKEEIGKSIFGSGLKNALTPEPSAEFRADVLREIRSLARQEKSSWWAVVSTMLEPKSWLTATAVASLCVALFAAYLPGSDIDTIYASSGFAAADSDIDDWLFSDVSNYYF